ncbi:MAG: S53 family peptidase, partial [Pirellulales bacterium]
MNAFARSLRHRALRPCSFETLEARSLLSADMASAAAALAPFDTTGPAFTGGPVAIPVAAADAAQSAVITGGYTPQQIRNAYGLDEPVNGNILDGTGQTISIIELYDDPYIATELANFDAYYGLPNPNLSVCRQPELNGAGMPANGTEEETALDVEWAHAMAPGANIYLVEGNPDDYGQYPPDLASAAAFLHAVSIAVQDPNVSVVSMSYGWTESAFTQYGYQVPDNYFVTPLGHQGITFVAASGDRAAGKDYPSIDDSGRFPAESPNVVGVGATVLATDTAGDWSGEQADPISGGGFAQEPLQPYQVLPGLVDPLGVRESPDVSWTDSQLTIYSAYNGGLYRFPSWAGTSASAPQFAGFMADVDEGRALAGEATLDGPSQTLPML